MTNNRTFIAWLFIAVSLAFSWYPLKLIQEMHLASPQMLFYAFASASLCTAPWLAREVKQWRSVSQSLLAIGLSASVMVTFLHFSLFHGDPASVFSIFCLVPVATLLVKGGLSDSSLTFKEFSVYLLIIIACIVILLTTSGGKYHWTWFTALLAGGACYFLFGHRGQSLEVSLISKVSAVLICSTWLVGMVIIFSPRVLSFPQENAVTGSVLYGIFFLIPVLFGVLAIMSNKQKPHFLSWLALLMVFVVISLSFLSNSLFELSRVVVISLLVAACILSIRQVQ